MEAVGWATHFGSSFSQVWGDPDLPSLVCVLDPTGSYYLTTTYGALEHIKNYDKITVTRQLSVEVQDSIHRWERRRTLNKARASRSSVQVMLGIMVTGAPDCTDATCALCLAALACQPYLPSG